MNYGDKTTAYNGEYLLPKTKRNTKKKDISKEYKILKVIARNEAICLADVVRIGNHRGRTTRRCTEIFCRQDAKALRGAKKKDISKELQ
jgi:hypothetical protein